jgi:hypothetical protein
MKPRPWSFTHYDEFVACPRLFNAKRIAKTVVEPPSPQIAYGIMVHDAFEKRQTGNKQPLPKDLEDHEPFMQQLDDMHGQGFAEYPACLSIELKPCGFWDKNVWLRQKIDFKKLMPQMVYIVDYKTGNPNYPKPEQLQLNALQTFLAHPEVKAVRAEFYWTQTHTTSKPLMIMRDHQVDLWRKFMPAINQLREAYELDIWQPRQNFRCYGFCPLTDCEFWKPKRVKS